MTQELTFSGLIVKFQYFVLLLVVVTTTTNPGLLGCWAAYTQQEGSVGRGFPSGMACTGSASKQNVFIPVIPCQEAGAVQVGFV